MLFGSSNDQQNVAPLSVYVLTMSVHGSAVSAVSRDCYGGRYRRMDSSARYHMSLINTDACGRTITSSENGYLGVSGLSTCEMNDAYHRMIPLFGAVSIIRP